MAHPSAADLSASAVVIQSFFRGYKARQRASHARAQRDAERRAALLMRAARVKQTLIASGQARSQLEGLDGTAFLETWKAREAAAVTVQKYVRGWRSRHNSLMPALKKQRNQAAVVIQKYARGLMVRLRSNQCQQRRGTEPRSRSPSPTDMLGMELEDGMLIAGTEWEQVCIEKIKIKLSNTSSRNEIPNQPEPLKNILERNQFNSRMVPKALVRAKKAREKCDHLLRTLQTRLELPCHDDLEPERYPRPPQGSSRETIANVTHAMCISDVIDVIDMSHTEAQRWDTAMQTTCQASFLWPWRDRDDIFDKACKIRWELLAKEEQARGSPCGPS